jgi:hypothetical protein
MPSLLLPSDHPNPPLRSAPVAEILYGDVCHDCIARCAIRLDHGPETDQPVEP